MMFTQEIILSYFIEKKTTDFHIDQFPHNLKKFDATLSAF